MLPEHPKSWGNWADNRAFKVIEVEGGWGAFYRILLAIQDIIFKHIFIFNFISRYISTRLFWHLSKSWIFDCLLTILWISISKALNAGTIVFCHEWWDTDSTTLFIFQEMINHQFPFVILKLLLFLFNNCRVRFKYVLVVVNRLF